MNVEFENRNTLTREQLRQLYRALYKPVIRKDLLRHAGAGALLLATALVLESSPWMAFVFAGFLGIVIRTFRTPRAVADQDFEKRLTYYGGRMPDTFIRFGEKIEIVSQEFTEVLDFRQVDSVLSLESGYFITTRLRGTIILSRNGFTQGTFAEFKQFLRNKRPDLEIPE